MFSLGLRAMLRAQKPLDWSSIRANDAGMARDDLGRDVRLVALWLTEARLMGTLCLSAQVIKTPVERLRWRLAYLV